MLCHILLAQGEQAGEDHRKTGGAQQLIKIGDASQQQRGGEHGRQVPALHQAPAALEEVGLALGADRE